MKKRIAVTVLISFMSFNILACQKTGNVQANPDDTNIQTVTDTKDTTDIADTPDVDDSKNGNDSKDATDNKNLTDDQSATDTKDTNDTQNASDSNTGNSSETTEKFNRNDEFIDKLIAEGGVEEDKIVDFIRDDFDGDGKDEAFAIVGDEDVDFGSVVGSAWFITDSKCENLFGNVGQGLLNEIREMNIGGTNYILISQLFVSESYTVVYYISDGELKLANFSGIGAVWYDEKNPDKFTITNSAYDMMWDNEIEAPIGHTWKKYYFFYDSEDGLIHEYGGTPVDSETIKKFCNRDLVNELVPEGDKIGEVFIRGNGMIVINYEHKDDSGSINYYHYIYDTSKEGFIDDMGNDANEEPRLPGTYLSCLVPDMAVYPEVNW